VTRAVLPVYPTTDTFHTNATPQVWIKVNKTAKFTTGSTNKQRKHSAKLN